LHDSLHRNPVEIIPDSEHLVSEEPQELQSSYNKTIQSPSNVSEYYTPTCNIHKNPISPLNIEQNQTDFPLQREKNEQSSPKNSIKSGSSHILSPPIVIRDENEQKNVNEQDKEEENDTDSECYCEIDEETEQENNEMNDEDSKRVKFLNSTDLTKPISSKYRSSKIIKQNQMLVRIDCGEDSKEPPHLYKRKFLRHNNFFQSIYWKEYIVILKPDVIELYENEVKYINFFSF